MKRKTSFLPTFLVVIFLCIIILALSLSGNLKFLTSFLEKGTSGIQAVTFGVFQKLPFVAVDEKVRKAEEKNLDLLSRLADFEKIKRENAALSDQFQTSYPQSSSLLEAQIIGAPGFVPGVSLPRYIILNKGSKDNVKKGEAVVVKNNLIGVIADLSDNLSKVNIVNNSSLSFTAKTESGAIGVVKGEDGNLTLENVLLSENMKSKELVLTYGDMELNGIGMPADLIVGEIISVEKNPSDLFQKAKLKSFVDFPRLSTVFVYKN
ncbi:MAG: rod shape-determining protein MreC [Candidatus Levybacteria bacterium]|nr:rod shape-determining protein MreC [Candidatus Levybacteria bacterium]